MRRSCVCGAAWVLVFAGAHPCAASACGAPVWSIAPPEERPAPLDEVIQHVIGRVAPSVVRVWCSDEDMITGTIITSDGLVLTCAHLPAPVGGFVRINLADGRESTARVLSKLPKEGESNLGQDLALLRITAEGEWPSAEVGVTSPTDRREHILALGFPDTLLFGPDRTAEPLYIRLGHPFRSPYQLKAGEMITSIYGAGGDSGGPAVDLAGRVVGVVHGGGSSGMHVGYTRIEELRRNWETLAPGSPPLPIPTGSPPRTQALSDVGECAAGIRGSVVEVQSASRMVALGCVIEGGLVLTKASELGPMLTVRTADGFVAIAEVAGSDPERDLALLRLEYAPEVTRAMAPIRFDSEAGVPPGGVLVLATPPDMGVPVGVACFDARTVPPVGGMIPCEFEEVDGGLRVKRVVDEVRVYRLRQAQLPLQVGDVLTHVEGAAVTDLKAFNTMVFESKRLGAHPAVSGEQVHIRFARADTVTDASVVLEFTQTPSGQLVWPVSNRYSGYPLAIATSLGVRPEQCGAPVADSKGRVVGVVAARAPLIETLVIPSAEVVKSLDAMRKAVQK